MDSLEILNYLPHRYPFLLVDKVLEIVPSERIVGQKNVSYNEHFFSGHFPNYPVMPGVLILEALAQVSCILATKSFDDSLTDYLYFLSGMENVRFKQMVKPGDQLRLESEFVFNRRNLAKFKTVALLDDGVIASKADLTCFRVKKSSVETS